MKHTPVDDELCEVVIRRKLVLMRYHAMPSPHWQPLSSDKTIRYHKAHDWRPFTDAKWYTVKRYVNCRMHYYLKCNKGE